MLLDYAASVLQASVTSLRFASNSNADDVGLISWLLQWRQRQFFTVLLCCTDLPVMFYLFVIRRSALPWRRQLHIQTINKADNRCNTILRCTRWLLTLIDNIGLHDIENGYFV